MKWLNSIPIWHNTNTPVVDIFSIAPSEMVREVGHLMENTMYYSNKLASIGLLVICLVGASAGLAQACNPNIPLKTPNSEFTDHGDGTVTHKRTGLIWKRCLEGQSGADCTGYATRFNWGLALVHAENHEFAGSSSWRLPNIKELVSIIEDACSRPAINISVFPTDYDARLWSSSPDYAISDRAWIVQFESGGYTHETKDIGLYVRLVRDPE